MLPLGKWCFVYVKLCVCVPLWSVCVNCSVFWGWIWHIYGVLCYFDLGPLTSFIVVLSTALSHSGKRCWKNCRTALHSHSQTESRPSSILLLIRHFNFPLWVRIESCESWDGWLILSRSPKRVSHVNYSGTNGNSWVWVTSAIITILEIKSTVKNRNETWAYKPGFVTV